MTNQLPPILPYQAPMPITPNFGMRAAKASWLAPLATLLLFAIGITFASAKTFPDFIAPMIYIIGVILWIIGLLSSVVALATMRRFGRKGILRPAIIGLLLNFAVLLLMLGFYAYALIGAGAAAAR